jgi:Chalcone isomerase-like
MRRIARLLLPTLLALPGLLCAQPSKPAFEDSFYLVGHKVKLNGTGMGQVEQVEGYKAGLYLVKPARSLFEALSSPGPKRLQFQIMREMPSNQLGLLLSQTLSNSLTGAELSGCMPGLATIGEAFGARKKLAMGDLLALDGVMSQGTHIFINGEKIGTIAGPAFFECLLKGYLGDKPKDPGLKKSLLNPPSPKG